MRKLITSAATLGMCLAAMAQGNAPQAADSTRGYSYQDAASQSYRLTLDECLQYAFGNSHERQSLKIAEKNASEGVTLSKGGRRPSVNLNVGENASHTGSQDDINFSGNAGISAGITLYEGGSISNSIAQSQQQEQQARLRTAQYDNSLSIEILNAYLAALRSGETIKFKTAVVETSREQAEQGQKKYKAGSILESDYLVLEAQYTANQTDTLDASISRTNSLLTLKRLMGMAPEARLDIVEPDTSTIDDMALLPSTEHCVARALETMPDLKLSQQAIEIAETQTNITKAGYRPTISASAGIGTSHRNFDDMGRQLGDNFYQQVGVQLSMPLYDRGNTKSRLAQNKYAMQQAQVEKEQRELEIRQTVIQQYQNVQLAYNRYKMARQKCDAYRQVLNVYNVKFNVGAVVITDLLLQQDNYINAINDYVQSKYAFILNRKILDVYTGDSISMGE